MDDGLRIRFTPPTSRAEDLVDRARFHDPACTAIDRAVQGITNARTSQRAEREAVLSTLEVTQIRGRRPPSYATSNEFVTRTQTGLRRRSCRNIPYHTHEKS